MTTVEGTRKRQKTGGRTKGTPNKVNREFRETVRKLLDDNAENVGTWITQVAEGHGENKADPAKALDLLAKLAEFAAPKLTPHHRVNRTRAHRGKCAVSPACAHTRKIAIGG